MEENPVAVIESPKTSDKPPAQEDNREDKEKQEKQLKKEAEEAEKAAQQAAREEEAAAEKVNAVRTQLEKAAAVDPDDVDKETTDQLRQLTNDHQQAALQTQQLSGLAFVKRLALSIMKGLIDASKKAAKEIKEFVQAMKDVGAGYKAGRELRNLQKEHGLKQTSRTTVFWSMNTKDIQEQIALIKGSSQVTTPVAPAQPPTATQR